MLRRPRSVGIEQLLCAIVSLKDWESRQSVLNEEGLDDVVIGFDTQKPL